MPGVTIHSNNAIPGDLDPPHFSSADRLSEYGDMSIADIKNKAKEYVYRTAGKASAASRLHVARLHNEKAKASEKADDLQTALESCITAATLIKMTMDSPEFKKDEPKGALRKEMLELINGAAQDLTSRIQSIEEKLLSSQARRRLSTAASSDKSVNKSFGGSIADRKRALQESGLAIGSPHRLPQEDPSLPNTPFSPIRPSVQPLPSSVLSNMTPLIPSSTSQSTHTFVPTSSFGPPSPVSSPSSSPQLSTHFDLSGFAQTFPSIDELDENPSFSLPSVPTGVGIVSSKSSLKDIKNDNISPSPSSNMRNFPLHIERPSSTPVIPTTNVFNSRPASPRAIAPVKPSGLASSVTPQTTQPGPEKLSIPKTNTVFPNELREYMRDYNVLVIDVRNRADFDREHMKAQAIVCIEPTVLTRDGMTANALEESMVIAPKSEANLFMNRDKFDIVAVCDESSRTFGGNNTPLSILIRLISEQEFKKMLKRMPMLVIGGVEAWKKEFGESDLVHGDGVLASTSTLSSIPTSVPIGLSNSQQVFVDNTSGTSIPLSPKPIQSPKHPFVSNGFGGVMMSPSLTAHGEHRPRISLDQAPSHSRSPAESSYSDHSISGSLQRRPAIVRPSTFQNAPALTNGSFTPISYPQVPPRRVSPTSSGSPPSSSLNGLPSAPLQPSQSRPRPRAPSKTHFVSPPDLASPPPASLNPASVSTRRRNEYLDQTNDALSGFNHNLTHRGPGVGPIDYPELMPIRPPPVAASSGLERQDQRPRVPPHPPTGSSVLTSPGLGYGGSNNHGMDNVNGVNGTGINGIPEPPRIKGDYPAIYWTDAPVGLSGLKNLGNTCYMNAPIQCLSATVPFARFFTDAGWRNAVNLVNPLGSKGRLTQAFAKLLHEMWGGDLPHLTPHAFRKSICQLRSQYDNSDQHDSQEFLSFLMDGIHEDLNRVIVKPMWTRTPEQEAELERLSPQIASEREWRAWKERNDSIVVDYFQGQFRNRLECLTCHQTSTTYNVFSILQLPIPHARSGRVPIDKCLAAFFNEEILEKDDAWDCPKCKTKRPASKKLSLARLPPVLLIHLKRFETNGRFSDKIDTFVDYPMESLDLTSYMPASLPPGADKSELNGGLPMSLDDPRSQVPPYRYNLYGVTNHYGNLTSGHYTAFVQSRGIWVHCDDSSIKGAEAKHVVNQKAYVLFYKRVHP